jgi:hypothetical protein
VKALKQTAGQRGDAPGELQPKQLGRYARRRQAGARAKRIDIYRIIAHLRKQRLPVQRFCIGRRGGGAG